MAYRLPIALFAGCLLVGVVSLYAPAERSQDEHNHGERRARGTRDNPVALRTRDYRDARDYRDSTSAREPRRASDDRVVGRPDRPVRSPGKTRGSTEAPPELVAALRKRLAAANAAHSSKQGRSGGADLDDPSQAPPEPGESLVARTRGSPQERIAALEERFSVETGDPEWTRNMHALLADMVEATELPAQALGNVACKTTVCRIELEFPDLESGDRLSELVYQDATNFEAFRVDDDGFEASRPEVATGEVGQGEGPLRYVVYAARPHQVLEDSYELVRAAPAGSDPSQRAR